MTDDEAIQYIKQDIEAFKNSPNLQGTEKLYIEALNNALKAFDFVDKVHHIIAVNEYPECIEDDIINLIQEYNNYRKNDNG